MPESQSIFYIFCKYLLRSIFTMISAKMEVKRESHKGIVKLTSVDINKCYDNMSIYHHWWFTEYAAEIAEYLYEREKLRPVLQRQSPQISFRSQLVNIICLVAEQKSLSITSVHLAVFLLDIFMDNHNIAVERLNLVALVCLQLGAKLQDRDVKVPKMSELNTIINNQYPLKDYMSVEIMIMEFFAFNISFMTCAHYVEYFIFLTVDESDFNESKSGVYDDYKHLKFVAYETVFEFLDLCLKDQNIVHTSPSIIAAAVICAARGYLKLVSSWTPDLQCVTAYSFSDIQPHAKKLIQLRESMSKKRKYISSQDSNYKLENVPENTPKRFKETKSKTTKFTKPKEVNKC